MEDVREPCPKCGHLCNIAGWTVCPSCFGPLPDLMLRRLNEANARASALEKENERLREVIAGFNPRVDAADFDQLAEIGLQIEESRKRMEEIQTRLFAHKPRNKGESDINHVIAEIADKYYSCGPDEVDEFHERLADAVEKRREILAAAEKKIKKPKKEIKPNENLSRSLKFLLKDNGGSVP